MIVLVFFSALSAASVNADLFHFDSISNVSTYYFNYLYCHVWEGECQPNHEDATQQGRSWGAEEPCLTPGGFAPTAGFNEQLRKKEKPTAFI